MGSGRARGTPTPSPPTVRASLIGGPFDLGEREVESPPPDVVLCTDTADATLEHLYRLRGVEPDGEGEIAVYEYAPEGSHPGG